MKRPLDGVRIVAIEQALAMPVATQELAALGAEVIRVESAQRMDAGARGRAATGTFSQLNRNKQGISLDFRAPEARDLLRGLVAASDVVVENFAAHVLAGFELDYAALARVRPDLIMLSITGYGHTGPYAAYRSFGPNSEAMGGLVWQTRHPAGQYLFPGGMAFGDTVAGHYGALGILAALARRRRTGRGCCIDLTQYEAIASFMGAELVATQRGEPLDNRSNDHPWMAPHGVYACAGAFRWIALAVSEDEQWQALARLMGSPSWAMDGAFTTRPGRLEHRRRIDDRLEEWTRLQDRDELAHRLQTVRIPSAPVQDAARDVALDELFWRRHALEMVDLSAVAPSVGVAAHNAPPWHFRHAEPALLEPPPAEVGRDNERVFVGLLGLTPSALARIEASDVASRATPGGSSRPEPSAAEQKRTGAIVDFDEDYRERINARAAQAAPRT